MRFPFLLALLLAADPAPGAAQAAGADLPPEIVEDLDRAMSFCHDLGGSPGILPSYHRALDLNGDGQDDHVTDQAGLTCAAAASAFCGTAGCPVSAWLSRGTAPGLDRFDFGYLQGFEMLPPAAPGDLPQLRATYHGTACDDPDRIGADACTRTWRFTTNNPAPPPVDGAGNDAGDGAADEAAAAARAKPMPEGWTLRQVPGGEALALSAGPGDIATLAGFCLEGKPFLALTFLRKPARDPVPVEFAFASGPLKVEAGFETTAGGAYVIALAGSPLAAALAGRDSAVDVRSDGTDQGRLSLRGSTRALRGALGACLAF